MIVKRQISDAFELIRNGISVKQDSEASGVPITRIETIADQTIDENRVGYANIDINDLGKYENYLLKEGDILMSHINSLKHLGKTAMYNGSPKLLIHGMNLLCFRSKVNLTNPKYINYYFKSPYFKQNLLKIANKSVNQASFSIWNLKEIKIPLPPLNTQIHIASILDDAAALRDKTAQLLKEYDLLAQSVFFDMFGDPVINQKKFKRSSIGQVAEIVGGSQPPKKVFKYELKDGYVRLVQIRDYKSDRFKTFIPKGSSRKFCTEEDIMIGRYGPPVFQILRGIAGAYNVALMKATPKSMIHKEYLFSLLSSHYVQNIIIGNSQRTAGQSGVNLKLLNSIEVSVPPIHLQNQFAEKITLIEQQKALTKQELQESEDLFNCLLQKAFKGELIQKEEVNAS